MRRVIGLAAVLILLFPGVAGAQESQPVDGGGGTPTFDLGGVGDAVEGAITRSITNWFDGPGQQVVLRFIGFLIGSLVRGVWALMEGSAGLRGERVQTVLVEIPEALVFGNPWVQQAHGVFQGAVNIGLVGALALALTVTTLGSLAGFTRDEGQQVIPWVLLMALLNNLSWGFTRQAATWFNGIALTFANPTQALPGWDSLNGMEQASGLGLASLGYLAIGVLLFLSRWGVVIGVAILSASAPFFLFCGLIPGLSILFHWWLRRVGLLLFQQIPQAMALGFGASLLAAFGSGASGLTLILGIAALYAAWRLPKWLPFQIDQGPSLYSSSKSAGTVMWQAYMAKQATVAAGAATEVAKGAGQAADDVIDAQWRPVQPAKPQGMGSSYQPAGLPVTYPQLPAPRD